jgi:hypothetical protein
MVALGRQFPRPILYNGGMARPLRALLVGAVLCFGTASFAFSFGDTPEAEATDDGGMEDMAIAGDMAVAIVDMSAAVPDMAKRPTAAKASLPGCSMAGSPVAPLGSALGLLLLWAALFLWAMRPRLVRARRTARRRP